MPDAEQRRRHRRIISVLDEHGTRLHAALVRLTLRHDVAADLLQDLFVRLGQSSGFDAAGDPVAYAWRTVINLATEWRRKRAKQASQQSLSTELPVPAPATASPLERMEIQEQAARVLDLLADLSELSRTCFVMRFIDQQSYEQIARRLGKTAHQVRGLCHAALRQLRTRLATEATRHV